MEIQSELSQTLKKTECEEKESTQRAVKEKKAQPAQAPNKSTANASTRGLFAQAQEEESALIKALREYIKKGNHNCSNILDVFIDKKTNKPMKDPQYPAALRKACSLNNKDKPDQNQSLELVKCLEITLHPLI